MAGHVRTIGVITPCCVDDDDDDDDDVAVSEPCRMSEFTLTGPHYRVKPRTSVH